MKLKTVFVRHVTSFYMQVDAAEYPNMTDDEIAYKIRDDVIDQGIEEASKKALGCPGELYEAKVVKS